MSSRGAQQQISIERLPSLLREVYEGRLLLPVAEAGSWDDERRIKLFESIYRGLPIGSLTVWRTTAHLDYRRTIGNVSIQAREEAAAGDRLRMYLVDGAGRVATLFEELGLSFWQHDKSSLRRRPIAARGSLLYFDLETRTFRVRQKEEKPRVTEVALVVLLAAETQHFFAAKLRALPDGERLANRLAHLVDTFFDFRLPVIIVASEDMESLQLFLSSLEKSAGGSRSLGPRTAWWYCDTCDQRIEHPSDGLVEGISKAQGLGQIGVSLRLVHVRQASPLPAGCQYDEQQLKRDGLNAGALRLADCLGSDGLTTLLAMFSLKVFSQEQIVEMSKRLHTPGYERARFHFDAAIQQGVFSPKLAKAATGFYLQEEIAATLEWADRTGRTP